MTQKGGVNNWMSVVSKARKAGYKPFDYTDKEGKTKHYIFAEPTEKIKLRVITEVDKNGKVINKSAEKAKKKAHKKQLKEKRKLRKKEKEAKAKAKAKK